MARKPATGAASTTIIILLLGLVAMTGGAFYWAAQTLEQRDARIASLEKQIDQLEQRDQRQKALASRVDELSQRVEQLSERTPELAQLEDRLAGLDKRVNELAKQSEQRDRLATRVDKLGDRVEQARRSDDELKSAINKGIEDYIAEQQGPGKPSRGDSAGADDKSAKGSASGLKDTDPILGNPDATISIIEYSDMECPYCQRLHQQGSIKQVVDGSDGQVNATMRHFPLTSLHGRIAVEAAVAAECVQMESGDEAFFTMLGAYFERTRSGGDGTGTPLAQFAADQTGLDQETVRSCMDSDEALQRVRSDFETGRSQGIQSTPTMVVHNNETGESQKVAGAVGADRLRQAVDSLSQ